MARRLTDKQARLLGNVVTWQKEHGADAAFYLFAEDRAVARSLIKRGLMAVHGGDDGSPPQFVVPTQAALEEAGDA